MEKILKGIDGERFPLIGGITEYRLTFAETADNSTVKDDEILWQVYWSNEYSEYEKVPFSGQKKGRVTTYKFLQNLQGKNLQLKATYSGETVELHITPQANGEIKIVDVFFLDVEYKMQDNSTLKYMNSVNLQVYTLNMLGKYVEFKIYDTVNGRDIEVAKSSEPMQIVQKNGIVKTNRSILLSPAMYMQTQKDMSASEHRYKVRVWERNNEANFYEEELKVKNEMGQMTVPQDSQTPVKTGTSEPPKKKEEQKTIEKTNGYFYNYKGLYEGHVKEQNGNENDVYACDGKGNEKDTFTNAKKLKISHNDFQRVCNIVKHEGLSNEENEYIFIAHANYNEGKDKGTTMLARLMTGYSSVEMIDKKTALPDTAVDTVSKYSRKGVIEALLRDIDPSKVDPTDGARFWDGVDFLGWGVDTELKADSNSKTGHNKFDEYDYIKIKKSLYDKFVMKIKQKYPNGAPYGSSHNSKTDRGSHVHKSTPRGMRAVYTIPASDFSRSEYWTTGDFYYKNKTKRATGITATQVAGYSIFWKEIK
ncbi:hypothetical protein QFZ37_002371 [Chryseobacterium ginsenosidimutans]|uniref:hypothetical protein n=1 Tax=Chryseobacterium ginsenosidimutans TaxID=687846 RepID=UPI00277F4FDD|nr:hypothetical protein [Chryseobacterium ginsenosidimutans]MDQ0594002.1 hypothetical protein [Chryseobacterium ginsenosidimutans]